MQLIIKPDDSSIPLLFETLQYRQIWAEHARPIRRAFRSVTGLEFQQRTITAHVFNGRRSNAGGPSAPMMLAGDYRTKEVKLATLVHELSHRLLGGNTLGPVNLGLAEAGKADTDIAIELDHRHIYLFAYDVLHAALGETGAAICLQYEVRTDLGNTDPHERAWKWAMGLSYEQRQRAMRRLAARKVLREQWPVWTSKSIKPIDPAKWRRWLDETVR